MKRDLDLCRQLLADIEGQGPECGVATLRPGLSGEAAERVRYHVRLLIDAGLAKEVDRQGAGAPCVRLTSAGHDLLELAANEARWREATWAVGERTGGLSLTVIKAVLTKWAAEAATRGYRPRRLAYRAPAYRVEPRYVERTLPERAYYERPVVERPFAERPVVERAAYERYDTPARRLRDRDWLTADDEPRLVRTRPDYLERFEWRDTAEWREAYAREAYPRDAYPHDTHDYPRDAYNWRDGFDWRNGADRERFVRETYPRDAYRYDWEADEYGVSLPIQVV